MIPWHRLFGLVLTDFFAGSCFVVELEKDLSQRKQLLDVVILRRSEGAVPPALPDGMEDLADHNLVTFKSHHEALSDWSLKELTGHYVNYRKQVSPGFDSLLPEAEFRLYALCVRFPQKLAGQLALTPIMPGAYDIERGTDWIRLIVTSELPRIERNAPLHLFSAIPETVRFGAEHFEKHLPETSTLINHLFSHYEIEGIDMPYTMADYRREMTAEILSQMTPEERLRYLNQLLPEERLKGLPPEERLKGLPPEERVKGLPPEERLKGLPPEERVKGLPPEELLRGLRSLPEDVVREIRRHLEAEDQERGNGDRDETTAAN